MGTSDQPIGSEGEKGAIQSTKVGEDGIKSPNTSKKKNIRKVKKSGEEKLENPSESGARGSYLGSPHHLGEKIAKNKDEKKEKDKDNQTTRKDEYLKDRKNGVKKDKPMEEVKGSFDLASVQVKKEQLEEKKSPLKAIDLTTDIEGKKVVLAIDLTKELKPEATTKKNISVSKRKQRKSKRRKPQQQH